jgi:hypothetical protein
MREATSGVWLVKGYIDHYNDILLNSVIGCTTPKDILAGHLPEARTS